MSTLCVGGKQFVRFRAQGFLYSLSCACEKRDQNDSVTWCVIGCLFACFNSLKSGLLDGREEVEKGVLDSLLKVYG